MATHGRADEMEQCSPLAPKRVKLERDEPQPYMSANRSTYYSSSSFNSHPYGKVSAVPELLDQQTLSPFNLECFNSENGAGDSM